MADLNVTLQEFSTNAQGVPTGTPIVLDNGSVASVPIIIKNAAGAGVTGITGSDFTINSASSPTVPISQFTVTADPDTTNNAGYYVINFTAGYGPLATQYLLIAIKKDADSGALFLDPSSVFDSEGISVINYPVNFGNQKFVLGQVNQSIPFTNVMSAAYNFVKAANSNNCKITLKGANPLQSIVIPANGTLVPVQVTVKDANSVAISGPQSVTIGTETVPLANQIAPLTNKADEK